MPTTPPRQPSTVEEFLFKFRPTGLLNLCRIYPKSGRIIGGTFDPQKPRELQEAGAFVQGSRSNGQHCYLTVNPVRERLAKKPSKVDIAGADYCHVDIDPDLARGYEAGRAHLLDAVVPELKAFEPRPTFVVDSGHGLGAFWRVLDGDVETVEALNRRLIERFGGDRGTGNIDRLMRVPGTINWVSRKKTEKGYPDEQCETRLLLDSGAACFVSELDAALPQEGGGHSYIDGPGDGWDVPPAAPGRCGRAFLEDATPLTEAECAAAERHLQEAQERHPNLASLWKGEPLPGQQDVSRSGFDFAAAGLLKSAGFSYRETAYLMATHFAYGKVAEEGPREVQRAWAASEQRVDWSIEGMFPVEVENAPEPPSIPEPGAPGAPMPVYTEAMIDKEIGRLLPGQDVTELLGRMVTVDIIRQSDTKYHDKCVQIGAATARPGTVVKKEFLRIRSRYNKITKINKQEQRTPKLQLIENVLSETPKGECINLRDLLGRYIWVTAENAFHDRVTKGLVPRASFDARYAHLELSEVSFDDTVGRIAASTVLLSHGLCVKVDATDYWPGQRQAVFQNGKSTLLNVWQNDGIQSAEGDARLWLDHLSWLVPNEAHRLHLLRWMAYVYRNQEIKVNHNILMGGAPRIGKDTLFIPLLAGIGEKNHITIGPDKVASDYEDWAVHKKLVVLNEMLFSGISPRKMENKLKPFGAAPPARLTLRRFNMSAGYEQRNILQILATSNYRDAAHMDTGVDRWFCVWCDPQMPESSGYYKKLHDWMDAGGSSYVLRYLESVDISSFKPHMRAPSTGWRRDLQEDSATGDPIALLADSLRELIGLDYGPLADELVKLDDVVGVLRAHLVSEREIRINRKSVSSALRRIGAVSSGEKQVKERGVKANVRLWAIKNTNFWANEKVSGGDWLKKYFSQGDNKK